MKNKTYEELAALIQHDDFGMLQALEVYQSFAKIGHSTDKLAVTNSILISKLAHPAAPIREAALVGLDALWTAVKNYDISEDEKKLFEQTKLEITQRAIVETVPGLQWLAIELLQPDACFSQENSL